MAVNALVSLGMELEVFLESRLCLDQSPAIFDQPELLERTSVFAGMLTAASDIPATFSCAHSARTR